MKQKLLTILVVLICLLGNAYAQERQVTGRVTSASDGTALAGVSVLQVGTNVATQTNFAGEYSISVKDNAILSFSFVGFSPQRINIGKRISLDVQLISDQTALDEVVVTGYGTTTRLKQTGSSVVIGSKEVEQTPFPSLDRALQGKVPGLQSTGGSGQPGSMQNIRIRGMGSISGSARPLYVIDGIPVNSGDLSRNTPTANALAGINPNDVENITVLKDAASTAIYGSRGANGVILITTKSGKVGKTIIRLDADYGSVRPGVSPKRARPLTTEENITLLGEALLNNEGITNGYKLTKDNIRDFIIDPKGPFAIDPTINTNWYDVVTRVGNQQQYNISADGGNEKTTFSLGGGFFKQEGTIPKSDFARYTGKINLKHKATEKLTVGTNVMLSTSNLRGLLNGGAFGNPVLNSFFLMPNYAARNPDGSINVSGPLAAGAGLYNPLEILDKDSRSNNTQKAIGAIYAEYNILPNLKVSSKYGIDYNNIEEDYYNNPNYGDGRNVGGRSYRDYTRYFNWVWTNLVDYRWDIDTEKNWVANIKAGYEAQKSQEYNSSVGVYNVPLNPKYKVPSVGATPIVSSGFNDDYSFASFLALGDFSYKNKYIVSWSYRNDGSSRFGIDKQYGNFWSAAASWNLEQEEFIKDISFINSLKLRSSYGVTGNAGIGNNAWRTLYGYTRTPTLNFVYDGNIGSGPIQYGLSNLTWERTHSFDVGVDGTFLDNRLSFVFDFYNRESEGLLYRVPVPYTTGFSNYIANFAGLRNRGVEFAISGTPVRTDDLQVNLNFNISLNKNTTTKLVTDDLVESPYRRKVGEDYFSFFLPQWAGADPNNGDPLWYVDETRGETTNDYRLAKRVHLGKSSMPKTFGSFGTNINYKGIGLDAMFYYNFGNHIYQGFYNYQNSGGSYYGSYNQSAMELERWQKAGDKTDVPKPIYGGNKNSFGASDRLLKDGSFIRLRDITLSYLLPSSIIDNWKISNARVYLRGSNLWTWVKDDTLPFDPESGSSEIAGGTQGITNFDVFIPKTITFGINVGF